MNKAQEMFKFLDEVEKVKVAIKFGNDKTYTEDDLKGIIKTYKLDHSSKFVKFMAMLMVNFLKPYQLSGKDIKNLEKFYKKVVEK